MTEAVPGGGVRFKENGDRLVRQTEFGNKVLEKGEGGKRIIQGIVPIAVGGVIGEICNFESGAEIAEGVGRLIGPGGAGEMEGIDPRTKAVAGESAKETFFGAMAVGNDGTAAQLLFQGRPERQKGGGFEEVIGGDAVDLAGGPGDVLIALQERNDGLVNVLLKRPAPQSDLNGRVGAPFGRACRFEIDGGEDGFGNLDGEEIAEAGPFGKCG